MAKEFEILNMRGQRFGAKTFRTKGDATAFLEKKITAPPARAQFMIQEIEPFEAKTITTKANPKKCKLVGEFVHCQIQPKKRFDPKSFRTVSPNEDVRITIGCPKGKWSGRKCKVSTEAQRIMYREDMCSEYKGCKVEK